MGKEENPSPLPTKPLSRLYLQNCEERKLAAAEMTIEQLQELFPELTPLQARLLLESVAPKARDDTGVSQARLCFTHN